jgi:hypothetical protein
MVYLDRVVFPSSLVTAARIWIDEPSCSLKILDFGSHDGATKLQPTTGQSYERASADSGQKAAFQAKITTAGCCTRGGGSDEGGELPSLLIAVAGRAIARTDANRRGIPIESFDEFCGQLALEFINFTYNNWTRSWGFALQ